MRSLSKPLRNLAKLRRLSWSETWLLVRVLIVLTAYQGLLLVFPFNRFIASAPVSTTPKKPLSDPLMARRIWAVEVISARFPGRFTCLIQALATKWLLGNHPAVRVHIGVRNHAIDGFSAHAWLTYQNRIILGDHTNQVFEPILTWE